MRQILVFSKKVRTPLESQYLLQNQVYILLYCRKFFAFVIAVIIQYI